MMRYKKEDQLHLSAWLIVIAGFAMAIPGTLVFGVIEYVCGCLIVFALLLLCFRFFARNSGTFRTPPNTPEVEDMNLWYRNPGEEFYPPVQPAAPRVWCPRPHGWWRAKRLGPRSRRIGDKGSGARAAAQR